jgi:hypothetical protein
MRLDHLDKFIAVPADPGSQRFMPPDQLIDCSA